MLTKKIVYAVGCLFSISWVTGFFFKLMHLKGAMLLLGIGGSGVAFIFIPLVLMLQYKDIMQQSPSTRLKWLIGSFSIILLMIASWMKLLHLQGAGLMLGVGFVFFALGFLPALFISMYKNAN